MKHVLVVTYSQTGQLRRLTESVVAPLVGQDDVRITVETIVPVTPNPFPWPLLRFFDTFPECVHHDPGPNQPLRVEPTAHFDLVILAYQVWFLSPASPITAFLQSADARRLLAGKPVITLIGCRNMWLMAQEQMKQMIAACGGTLIDNIVLTDQGSALETFVTTPRWLLTGKQGPLWGVLSAAGIAPSAIADAARFGHAILRGLRGGQDERFETMLRGLGAVTVDGRLIASERIGHRSFRLWGQLIRKLGKQGDPRRLPVVVLYIAFLLSLIVTVVPVSMLVRRLLEPLRAAKNAELVQYFEQPSGSDRSALAAAASVSSGGFATA